MYDLVFCYFCWTPLTYYSYHPLTIVYQPLLAISYLLLIFFHHSPPTMYHLLPTTYHLPPSIYEFIIHSCIHRSVTVSFWCFMAHGSWRMAQGSWLMVQGSWFLAQGSQLMAKKMGTGSHWSGPPRAPFIVSMNLEPWAISHESCAWAISHVRHEAWALSHGPWTRNC